MRILSRQFEESLSCGARCSSTHQTAHSNYPRPMTFKKFSIISVMLLGLACSGFTLGQAQNKAAATRKVSASARIQWKAQRQVSRYRLQVARDEGFTDMVIDKAVSGNGYVISGLPEGKYYWRVAPIGGEGGNYSSRKSVRLVRPQVNSKPKEPGETASAKKPVKPADNASKSRVV